MRKAGFVTVVIFLQRRVRNGSILWLIAVGAIVYEWLCGEQPFCGTFAEVVAKHVFVPPPPLREKNPSIPQEVEQVVAIALAKNPYNRFASVHAFARALEQASGALPSSMPDLAEMST